MHLSEICFTIVPSYYSVASSKRVGRAGGPFYEATLFIIAERLKQLKKMIAKAAKSYNEQVHRKELR
jgi:hypothetical protein